MTDMTSVIVPKSDQINADDLIPGPRTVTITAVSINPGSEQPVSISIEGDKKFWRPCKSMSRVLVAMWGPDAKAYVGRSLTLYRDPNVKWGGLAVGGIRISHMSHIAEKKTMALTETRAQRKPFTVQPLVLERQKPAEATDDPARKFTFAFLAKLGKMTDPAEVQAFAEEKAGKLAELRTKRPELAAEIDVALADKLGADDFTDDLTDNATAAGDPAEGATSDDDAAPSSQEGKPDEERGEQPSLDEAKTQP